MASNHGGVISKVNAYPETVNFPYYIDPVALVAISNYLTSTYGPAVGITTLRADRYGHVRVTAKAIMAEFDGVVSVWYNGQTGEVGE